MVSSHAVWMGDGSQVSDLVVDQSPMVNLLKSPERQLRSLRADPEGRSRCEHSYMETSHISGLERVVCEICGHVSIKAVAHAVTKGPTGSTE